MGMTGVSNLKARAALLMVGLLATLLVLALSACGSGGSAQEEDKARPLPEDPKALRPGEYRSTEYKPSFSFRVGKGWRTSSEFPQVSDKLAITRGEYDPPQTLIFRNLHEVFEYTKTGTTPEVVKAPKDMVGWFQHHPYLKTEKSESATVGGVKGVQFDYILSEDAPYEEINLFRYTDGSAGKGFKYRAIILEGVEGKTVTIGIGSLAIEFDDLLSEAQKVLATVKWRGL